MTRTVYVSDTSTFLGQRFRRLSRIYKGVATSGSFPFLSTIGRLAGYPFRKMIAAGIFIFGSSECPECPSNACEVRCRISVSIRGPMRAQVSNSLAPADPSALIAPEIATGWALFGSSSEWVLQFVCAHRATQPIPKDNV